MEKQESWPTETRR